MVQNYKLSVNVCAHGFLALKLPLFFTKLLVVKHVWISRV